MKILKCPFTVESPVKFVSTKSVKGVLLLLNMSILDCKDRITFKAVVWSSFSCRSMGAGGGGGGRGSG